MTRHLAPALAALLALAALAGCQPDSGTAGSVCDRPGAIRVEHPDPSTTNRFRCVTDPDGRHAHWAVIR